ncbi:MAG: DEAD/DEAH box helicase [Chitinophagaceae bacterium]|nr:MAG: DEAD/DEAH box helicase [Chitinophagaceae bacterium]
MADAKKDIKAVLLLSPYKIFQDHQVLEILVIDRSAPKSPFTNKELISTMIRQYFPEITKEFRELLVWFNKEGISFTRDVIKKKFNKQKAGISFSEYYSSSISRHLFDLFQRIKPFAHTVQWYHKTPVDNVRFTTAACSLSRFRPTLHFELYGNKDTLSLRTMFLINGDQYDINFFKRYEFMLESNNEYFLLNYKDAQTLNWLDSIGNRKLESKPEIFVEDILGPLEQDYNVERNGLLEATPVEVLPVNRVMLSEISNSFLMLTPQWVYDGFVIEDKWQETVKLNHNSVEYLIRRNKQKEDEFRIFLESLHPGFPKQMNGYYYLGFAEAQKNQWFPKAYHKLLASNIEVTGMDMLKHFRYSPHQVETTAKFLKEDGNVAILQLKITFGAEEIQLTEMQKMLLAAQRTVLLKDGSIGVLSDQWLSKYAALIKVGKISNREIRVPRWLAFSDDESAELQSVIKSDWLIKWKLWQQQGSSIYEVDPQIKAKLRPYQKKGFEWMMLLAEAGAGACLADDMGLGKTLQTICFISAHVLNNLSSKHLIVCPSSLLFNWKQEVEKFAPHLSCHIHHGSSRVGSSLSASNHQIIVTSYGTLRSDFEIFSSMHFQTLILDESHYIKNPSAQITKLVNQLSSDTRIALSGTPVMNNTFDLYAQLDFLLPGIFGSKEYFKREFADPIDRDKKAEKITGLQRLTAPFILRRTKEQVAPDLPAKTEMIMWCEMSAAQKENYENIRDRISSSLLLNIKKDGLQKNKLALLQGILKLRQICNSPLLLPADEQTCIDSVKTTMLMDELSYNLGKNKTLVFSQFTTMLDLLAEECSKKGISYYHFDGQTPPQKRADMVRCFQDPEDRTNVFLISLKAGNAGLNLTAADYVFLFDPWWNTAVQQQAIDRTHRIGQTKKVFAYKMICRDTIEEKIIQLQQRKKQLAEDLVGEEEGFVKSLSEEDIMFLFS